MRASPHAVSHRTPRLIQNAGYVLTEMLITVAIIAVVLATVASVAMSESASREGQNEARMIEQVADDLRLMLTRQDSFAGIDLQTTIDTNLWPESRVIGGNSVVNAWGANITLQPAVGLDPAGRVIRMNINGIPSGACASFASYPFSYERMTVDGTIVYDSGQFGPATRPVDVAAAAAQCADGADVVVFFHKDIF